MITISNLGMQFGGSVLFKQVDLQFTPATATASSARTAPANPPS